jgi:hypothetical protein
MDQDNSKKGRAMDQGRQAGGELGSVFPVIGPAATKCVCGWEPLASVSVAQKDWKLVVDEFAAELGEDRLIRVGATVSLAQKWS